MECMLSRISKPKPGPQKVMDGTHLSGYSWERQPQNSTTEGHGWDSCLVQSHACFMSKNSVHDAERERISLGETTTKFHWGNWPHKLVAHTWTDLQGGIKEASRSSRVCLLWSACYLESQSQGLGHRRSWMAHT